MFDWFKYFFKERETRLATKCVMYYNVIGLFIWHIISPSFKVRGFGLSVDVILCPFSFACLFFYYNFASLESQL